MSLFFCLGSTMSLDGVYNDNRSSSDFVTFHVHGIVYVRHNRIIHKAFNIHPTHEKK